MGLPDLLPTFHLQRIVNWGIDYIPSCLLMSTDQTLPSVLRNPSLSSSDTYSA